MAETTPTQRSAHLIQGNSSASRLGAHMPVTFEGDEPPDCWQWISDMRDAAKPVLIGIAFLLCLALGAAFLIAWLS